MASAITSKLFSKHKSEQDYIFKFFFCHIYELLPQPTKYFAAQLKLALENGDKRFYDAIEVPFDGFPPYFDAVKKEWDEFKERPQEEPVQSSTEDDVPF